MNEGIVTKRGISTVDEGRSSRSSLIWYGLLSICVMVGWLLRDYALVNPKNGLGYWLGIVGGSLMLFLLFYPAGKKSQLLQRLGVVKYWFQIHIVFGLLGPLLVLYHCNFTYGATNSKVALFSMLIVAGSGIVGRHIYLRIHRGLTGRRSNIDELRSEITRSLENSRGIASIFPSVTAELYKLFSDIDGCKYTKSLTIGQSLGWSVKYLLARVRLTAKIDRELTARAILSDVVRGNARDLRMAARHYVYKQLSLMRRVAQLSFYEQLFSIWHVFHMPLFLLLVISGLVHVLAVHMY